MKRKIIILMAFILMAGLYLHGAELKLLKTIGDDRDDYTFLSISEAVLSESKDIYVLDPLGVFIAKYDWAGNFISRTGQKGQGPTDYNYPRFMNISQDKLYILDYMNHRIVQTDLAFDKFEYFKLKERVRFDSHFFALPEGQFVGVLNTIIPDKGKIGIMNKAGDFTGYFFNEFPVDPGVDTAELDKKNDMLSRIRSTMISQETKPVIGIDHDRKHLLISFLKPNNPVDFFVYTIDGQLKKKFSYRVDSKYKFFDLYIKAKSEADLNPQNFPREYFTIGINYLFFYDSYYIATLRLFDKERGKKESKKVTNSLLIFNTNGELRQELLLDDNLGILFVSREGYVLGTKWDEEITKLYIYKLEL